MRALVASTIAASLVAAGLLAVAGSTPAAAARQYPWCERTDTTGFTPSCTFTSYAQCMATVSGQRGDCVQNPYLAFGQAQQSRRGRAVRGQPSGYDNGWNNGWNNNGWNQRW
jgi:hypothetical protein